MTPLLPNLASQFPNREFQTQWFHPQKAHINMVGWTANLDPSKFPKDNKNVSPKKTPELVSTWPCRHGGSGKHWDYKCKHL